MQRLRFNLWLATHALPPRLRLLAWATLYMLLDR